MSRVSSLFAKAAGVAGLTLALTLTGCGQASTDDQATNDQAVEAEATEDEQAADQNALDIPAELAPITDQVRSMTLPTDTTDADLDAYETVTDDELAIEPEDEISEASGDSSKAAAGMTIYQIGGMQLTIPTSWHVAQDGYGYSMLSSDGGVYGYGEPVAKEAGYTYDVASMAAGYPKYLSDCGYTNIEVVVYDTIYSTSGKLVDSYIQVKCDADGESYMFYTEYLESKSYINYLCGCATVDKWNENFDDISAIINSVSFTAGEAI